MSKIEHPKSNGTRLNKYIANAGICARRKADEHIAAGRVTVNDETILAMGHRVQPGDIVKFDGEEVIADQKLYVLLNKPKDFITTTDDERDRKTVMELIKNAVEDVRVYPVGRLDRKTTGLLLLTNDGQLAQKLAHPSGNVRKIYQVTLDKDLTDAHFKAIEATVMLEDGEVPVDDLAWPNEQEKNIVGISIHIGRNRIVRRLFEHFGYVIKRLDRVVYAGLTKKNLPRGNWRYLTEEEIIRLKYLK